MPFVMKIQPIDVDSEAPAPTPVTGKPKSRLKRLFDRNVLRINPVEKLGSVVDPPLQQLGLKDGGIITEFDPSSVCLSKMVQSYIEGSSEKSLRGRQRCNCFNGNGNDSSDDELDLFGFNEFNSNGNGVPSDAADILKSLIQCWSVRERNLLADTATIVDKNKNIHKQKDSLRKIVTEGLVSLGYNSAVCKSKWDKHSTFPSGEYEYVDVIMEGGERIIIDIEFRSEFEIARSTGAYKTILQSLPLIYVGTTGRLTQIVSIVSEAAKQSLKKKGMPFPPWRKQEYMLAKWLSPYTRLNDAVLTLESQNIQNFDHCSDSGDSVGELELIFGEKECITTPSPGSNAGGEVLAGNWQPPALKPKSKDRGVKMATGLASLFKEKP